jgi:hypothetical protein
LNLESVAVGGTYQQGWDDCLDAVLSILQKAKDLREAVKRALSQPMVFAGTGTITESR